MFVFKNSLYIFKDKELRLFQPYNSDIFQKQLTSWVFKSKLFASLAPYLAW